MKKLRYYLKQGFDPSKLGNKTYTPDNNNKATLHNILSSDVSKLVCHNKDWHFDEIEHWMNNEFLRFGVCSILHYFEVFILHLVYHETTLCFSMWHFSSFQGREWSICLCPINVTFGQVTCFGQWQVGGSGRATVTWGALKGIWHFCLQHPPASTTAVRFPG